MLLLVVSDNHTSRRTHIEAYTKDAAEIIVFDDTQGTIADLEQYLYPSLFSVAPPVIQVKFMLGDDAGALTNPYLQKLVASPTVFVFEEMMLAPTVVTVFKKAGATVHVGEKSTAAKKDTNIFAIAACITAPDKKSRWMAYQDALAANPIEAIVGILYWKVRDLALKTGNGKYLSLYKKLLEAHACAWETGAPLELLIEKVILSQ